MKNRVYKFDNTKALLIFLVVVGHLTSDYVSDYRAVRWFTLWIYTFHMPAFIFISGLFHKRYITAKQSLKGIKGNTEFRFDKFLFYLLCAYALKAFLYLFRTAIGQHPRWDWIAEPGIPWYLIVLAEYEIILFLIRRIDWKIMIPLAFAVSAVIGYFPAVDDRLSLSRMVNFLPIFLIGYYMETDTIVKLSEKLWAKIVSAGILIYSVHTCYHGKWKLYSYRKYFTGRRSYAFLEDFFPGTMDDAWRMRLNVWAMAIILTFALLILIPNREIKYISVIGERSIAVYFWHRAFCYWICGVGVYPMLVDLCNGSDRYSLIIYVLLAAVLTLIFSSKIFMHPAQDIQALSGKIAAVLKGKGEGRQS